MFFIDVYMIVGLFSKAFGTFFLEGGVARSGFPLLFSKMRSCSRLVKRNLNLLILLQWKLLYCFRNFDFNFINIVDFCVTLYLHHLYLTALY